MSSEMKGYRVILQVESTSEFVEYTGKITKTLVFALNPDLQLIRGIKGVLSPLHISPLFKPSGDYELGEPSYPFVLKRRKGYQNDIKPIRIQGEYVFHIGGEEKLVDHVITSLSKLSSPLIIKIGDALVSYRVEKIIDVTRIVRDKVESLDKRVRVYLKAPAQVFNVFVPTKLPKFTPSALELLLTPYALISRAHTITDQLIFSATKLLGNLVETWYSLKTLWPIEVYFNNKKQTLLGGYVTYILESRTNVKEELKEVLATAELAGIGRSRMNGFGTTVVLCD
jgi:hypothetical protein